MPLPLQAVGLGEGEGLSTVITCRERSACCWRQGGGAEDEEQLLWPYYNTEFKILYCKDIQRNK